jgi:hypothetical protein
MDVSGVKTMKKYFLIFAILLVTACSSTDQIEEVRPVEVVTVEVPRPAPIVPNVDQLRLRNIQWVIITPENAEQKFAEIRNGEAVLFAVTAQGYENIALNLSDIRALIAQQQRIIAIYKSQYE